MSRYRPPAAKKTPYITAEGMKLLEQEQKALWHKRRQVVIALTAAAEEGDRSENAEYIYRKKELREMDRRIRYLQKRLPDLKVVEARPDNREQVFFGATVWLVNESDEESQFRIVGPDEHDREGHYISIDSPLAKALLKRELGEEVEVHAPGGVNRYPISRIEYA